jgi:hypothetical protein
MAYPIVIYPTLSYPIVSYHAVTHIPMADPLLEAQMTARHHLQAAHVLCDVWCGVIGWD